MFGPTRVLDTIARWPKRITATWRNRIRGAFARASSEAVVVGDPSGLIVELNPAAADMFGYAREELLGRPVDVLFPPALLERQTAALSRLRETRTPRVKPPFHDDRAAQRRRNASAGGVDE